jgi:hypothetical protein
MLPPVVERVKRVNSRPAAPYAGFPEGAIGFAAQTRPEKRKEIA